jgi:hypothetical protein
MTDDKTDLADSSSLEVSVALEKAVAVSPR